MKKINISPGAILLLSAVSFFGGILDLSALLTAAFVHELGHMAALKISGGRIRTISFGFTGAVIEYSGVLTRSSELFSILAGPLSGAALAYATSYIGNTQHNIFMLKTAGYSAVLTAFNMLPAKALDGGRALNVILSGLFGVSASQTVLEITGYACSLAMLCLGLYCHHYEFAPVLFGGGLMLLISQSGIVKSG